MAAETVSIVFFSAEAIMAIIHAITEAATTVRQNKEECEGIAKCVASVSAVLRMYGSTPATAMDPAMRGALDDLKVSLNHALNLVTKCQEKRKVPRFLRPGDLARELSRVQDDIDRKVTLGIFAASVQNNVALANMQRALPRAPPVPDVAPQPVPWQWPVLDVAPQPVPWQRPVMDVAPQPVPWQRPVPDVAPQPVPWPMTAQPQVAPSMADFCCPNNYKPR